MPSETHQERWPRSGILSVVPAWISLHEGRFGRSFDDKRTRWRCHPLPSLAERPDSHERPYWRCSIFPDIGRGPSTAPSGRYRWRRIRSGEAVQETDACWLDNGSPELPYPTLDEDAEDYRRPGTGQSVSEHAEDHENYASAANPPPVCDETAHLYLESADGTAWSGWRLPPAESTIPSAV